MRQAQNSASCLARTEKKKKKKKKKGKKMYNMYALAGYFALHSSVNESYIFFVLENATAM